MSSPTDSLPVTAILTETGTELKFDVNSDQAVGALLALHTAIAVHDQIVLSADGNPVSGSQPVSTVSLPLFIYSRRILESSASTSSQNKLSVRFDFEPLYQQGIIQREGSQDVNTMGLNSEYIRYMSQALQTVYDHSQRQLQGLRIAMLNLDKRILAYDAAIQQFADAFSRFSEEAEDLGRNFEEFIRRLSSVEIHKALSYRQETLLDKLSEGRLRSKLSRLQRDHELVMKFVTELYQQRKTIMDSYRGETELLEEPATASSLFCFPFTPLHHLTILCSAFRKICSDINDVKARVSKASISNVIGDRLSNLLNIERFQSEMMDYIRNWLCSVSDIETRIRHETKRILAYNEVLSQKHTILSDLRGIESIPEAYFAALIEILRRRSYIDHIRTLAETIESLRSDEVGTRSLYMEQFGRCLPKELLAGLDHRPPRYFASVNCTSEDLPSINSLEDVEFPSSFQLTDKLTQLIRRCKFDKAMIPKLPLSIRKILYSLELESGKEKSLLSCNNCPEGSREGERSTATVSNVEENVNSRSKQNVDTAKMDCSFFTAEIQKLRLALLEKDRRIAELENEVNSLTMSTAILYQENKTLNDIVSRPQLVLADFKLGDLIGLYPGSNQLLNLDCPGYHLIENNSSSGERDSGRLKVGIITSIEAQKNKLQDYSVQIKDIRTL